MARDDRLSPDLYHSSPMQIRRHCCVVVCHLEMYPLRSSMLPARQIHQVGVTLIELMVTVAVLAILLMLVAPSFVSLMASNKIRSLTSHVETTLAEARTQAIRTGKRVTVCVSADGTSCAAAGDWAQGWIVFIDTTRDDTDAVVDSGETILSRVQAIAGDVKVLGSTHVAQFVSYAPDGQAKLMNGAAQTGTLRICSSSAALTDDRRARDLVLNGTGRVQSLQATGVASSCDAPD